MASARPMARLAASACVLIVSLALPAVLADSPRELPPVSRRDGLVVYTMEITVQQRKPDCVERPVILVRACNGRVSGMVCGRSQ